MVEVFPAPLGPRKPKHSCRCTLKSISFTAVKEPYVLVRWRASTMACIDDGIRRGKAPENGRTFSIDALHSGVVTRAVLFDLDETLFDHAHSARSGLAQLRETHPPLAGRSLAELEVELRRLLDEMHPHVLQGLLTLDQARIERLQGLFRFCGASITAEEAEQAAARYREAYGRSRRAVPGAIPLLEALRHQVCVGVVSNNLTREQEEKLEATGIAHLIDFLVTSEDAGAQKPDPAIFQEGLRRAGCAAGEAVMVGDSWEWDVLGARNAGIRAVWLNRGRLPCPDPSLAHELHALEPVQQVAEVILGAIDLSHIAL